jgi:signal transduction histidine kinase/ActR/RegA family two-component response regulator
MHADSVAPLAMLGAHELAMVLRNVSDGITVQAPSGELLFANVAAASLIGFDSVDELLSCPVAKVIDRFEVHDENGHPLELGALPSRRALNGELVPETMLGFRAPTGGRTGGRTDPGLGDLRWAVVSSAPVRGETGEVRFAVNVFRDVTERRRREIGQRFLAEASALLASPLDQEMTLVEVARLAVTTVADLWGVYLIEADGSIRPAALAHVDPAKHAIAEELLRLYPEDVQAQALLRSGRSYAVGDLSPEWLEATAAANGIRLPARAGDLLEALALRALIVAPLIARGRILGALTFGLARSSRRHVPADVALVEDLASRVATAVDNARLFRDAARARDRSGRLQAVTAAFSSARTVAEVSEIAVTEGCAALGSPRGLIALVAPSAPAATLDVVRMVGFPADVVARWRSLPLDFPGPIPEAARSGEPGYYETPAAVVARFPNLAGEGGRGDQALAALPLVTEGRTLGTIGLVFDQPRAFSDEDRWYLMWFARQCALALDRAALYESEGRARREAEAANRAKDLFLATVSHELRTPLSAILGWSRMLRTGAVADERRGHALETIERNARAQVRLVEDLLDITRITSGQLRLACTTVDVRAAMEAALEAVRPSAEAKGIALAAALDTEPATIEGDPERIQQCVWNLLANAVKFTPRGGSVDAGLHRRPGAVEIRVADSGDGIAPAFLPHVFDAFRQADSSMSRGHGGLGLGLAIVKHLVTLHGGSVEAKSDGLGRGAAFTLRLPCVRAQAEASPTTAALPPRTGEHLPAVTLDGLRIVAVDDDEDTRDLVRTVLEGHRAAVLTAASAREGLSLVERMRPDVLVTDLGMPGQTGYDLLRAVRALPPERGGMVPAIALTAFARQEDRGQALEAGFAAHMAKPVEPSELVNVIAGLAARRLEPPAPTETRA